MKKYVTVLLLLFAFLVSMPVVASDHRSFNLEVIAISGKVQETKISQEVGYYLKPDVSALSLFSTDILCNNPYTDVQVHNIESALDDEIFGIELPNRFSPIKSRGSPK